MSIFFNLCISLTPAEAKALWDFAAVNRQTPSTAVTGFVERLLYRKYPLDARPRPREVTKTRCFSVPRQYKEPLLEMAETYELSMGAIVRRELPPPIEPVTKKLSDDLVRVAAALPQNKACPKSERLLCDSRFCRNDSRPRLMLWRYSRGDYYCCNCRATIKPTTPNQHEAAS